jgi:hypothetical protein
MQVLMQVQETVVWPCVRQKAAELPNMPKMHEEPQAVPVSKADPKL